MPTSKQPNIQHERRTHHDGAYFMPVTLWQNGGDVDEEATHLLFRRMISAGAKSIIAIAASGESAEASCEDAQRVVRIGLEEARGTKTNIYSGVPWETRTSLALVDTLMADGMAGVMELPPTYPYYSMDGLFERYSTLSRACGGNLIIYAKNSAPSDALLGRLAGEGLICAAKVAADAVAFEMSANAIRRENPGVLVIQGAAERFLPGVLGLADGYTTGTGVVFPRLALFIQAAVVEGDLKKVRDRCELFRPLEEMRSEHGTGYNVAPLKVALKELGIGDGSVRPRLKALEQKDLPRLKAMVSRLIELEQQLAEANPGAVQR